MLKKKPRGELIAEEFRKKLSHIMALLLAQQTIQSS
jgi:hypothetical protein